MGYTLADKACWFCGSPEGERVSYSYTETPEKTLFWLHPGCKDRMGVAGELTPTHEPLP